RGLGLVDALKCLVGRLARDQRNVDLALVEQADVFGRAFGVLCRDLERGIGLVDCRGGIVAEKREAAAGGGGRQRNRSRGIAHASASACSRSAMMSSLSSMPTESRTTSGPAPAATFCASESWRCVVEAGWMISERVSPMLARWENNFTLETSFTPA